MQADQRRIGETLAELLLQARRKTDLRYQHQRLFARRQGARDQAQVDLGLAAAGDPMQQEDAVAGARAFDLSQGFLLFGVEWKLFDESADARLRRQLIALDPAGAAEFGQHLLRARALRQQQVLGTIGLRQSLEQRALHSCARGQLRQRLAPAGTEAISGRLFEYERGACFSQPHRQTVENDFAQWPVIVVATELRQVQPVARERRSLAQDAHCGLQFIDTDCGRVGETNDYAHRLLVAEGHQHAHANVGMRRLVTTVIEYARQRQVERDAQYAHLPPEEKKCVKEATREI